MYFINNTILLYNKNYNISFKNMIKVKTSKLVSLKKEKYYRR